MWFGVYQAIGQTRNKKKGATLVDDSLCWFIREIRVIRGFFFPLAYAAIPFGGIAQMFIESASWRSFS